MASDPMLLPTRSLQVTLILLVPAHLPQSSTSLQAQAPCSPAKASPDLAKFLYFLSTFVFWCLQNCFSEERPPLNRSWRSLVIL